jgi:hypothetical protein
MPSSTAVAMTDFISTPGHTRRDPQIKLAFQHADR